MSRTRGLDPRRLDVTAFAADAGVLSGTAALADLPRLQGSLMAQASDLPVPPVQWTARGERRRGDSAAPQTWLQLQADGRVTLQCQRCLQPLAEPLQVDRWFRFAADEDEAARLDEEQDDDVLVASVRFDLLALLEDELILALPLVPRHAVCPQPLVVPQTDAVDEPAEHAFAALAALRRPPADPVD